MLCLMLILITKHIHKYRYDLYKLYSKIKPYISLHFLLCFGVAWMITNGWSYLFIILGNKTMRIIGTSYLAFLWLPTTPEKLITIPIACYLVKHIFPKDFETLKKIKEIN